jgi:hypothetical protein
MITFLDWVGRVTAVIFLVTLALGIYAWLKGILPALWRLGNGFSKRKIAIFAKGDTLIGLKGLLLDTKLFSEKNIIDVSSNNDFGRAERATLFLVSWHDWQQDQIDEILRAKKDTTALIVYAPQDLGFIPKDKMKELDSKRNVTVANLRGRLLNDIVVSLMTTSYQ